MVVLRVLFSWRGRFHNPFTYDSFMILNKNYMEKLSNSTDWLRQTPVVLNHIWSSFLLFLFLQNRKFLRDLFFVVDSLAVWVIVPQVSFHLFHFNSGFSLILLSLPAQTKAPILNFFVIFFSLNFIFCISFLFHMSCFIVNLKKSDLLIAIGQRQYQDVLKFPFPRNLVHYILIYPPANFLGQGQKVVTFLVKNSKNGLQPNY